MFQPFSKEYPRRNPGLTYVAIVFAIYVATLQAFRIALLLLHRDELIGLPDPVSLIGKTLLHGLRFDASVAGYMVLLLLPLVAVVQLRPHSRFSRRGLVLGAIFLHATVILLCMIDIPFFEQFRSRLSSYAIIRIDQPGYLVGLVTQDAAQLAKFLGLVAATVLLSIAHSRLLKKAGSVHKMRWAKWSALLLLTLLAMRGLRISGKPIGLDDTQHTSYALPNLLSANAVFTFAKSLEADFRQRNKPLQLLGPALAREVVTSELGRDPLLAIAPPKTPGDGAQPNVVLILMEGMSASFDHKFTPNLQRIKKSSHTFANFYTAGTHTYNGLFTTITGIPTFFRRHPMKHARRLQYASLPMVMTKNGYHSIYFTTHDDDKDNVGAFLQANGVHQRITVKDYPKEEVLSILGVPDHVMFDRALMEIDQLSSHGVPFFSLLLTASNHAPYVIPDVAGFATHGNRKERALRYADWALGRFIDAARDSSWYSNTVFVLMADHGQVVDPVYDMPLSYHHGPLIIHAPGRMPARQDDRLAIQADVFPTLMALLGLSFKNETLGINLLRQTRKYAFFSSDDRLGCLDHELFLVSDRKKPGNLYRYRSRRPEPASASTEKHREMITYARAMLQVADSLIERREQIPF